MKVQDASQPYDSINVTPMLDLAYVLLVVFILMTTASVQGLHMTLPRPSNKPPAERHELLIIQVARDNRLLLGGAEVTPTQLEQNLIAAQRRDRKASAAIKGEAGARYDQIVQVIDLCNRLGMDMGLVTARIGT